MSISLSALTGALEVKGARGNTAISSELQPFPWTHLVSVLEFEARNHLTLQLAILAGLAQDALAKLGDVGPTSLPQHWVQPKVWMQEEEEEEEGHSGASRLPARCAWSVSCSRPVFCVICLLVIICLHLGSISSLFLFCFRHCSTFLASASVQNRWGWRGGEKKYKYSQRD